MQNILLSDTSSDDDDDNDEVPVTEAELKEMLKEHVRFKRHQKQFARNKEVGEKLKIMQKKSAAGSFA